MVNSQSSKNLIKPYQTWTFGYIYRSFKTTFWQDVLSSVMFSIHPVLRPPGSDGTNQYWVLAKPPSETIHPVFNVRQLSSMLIHFITLHFHQYLSLKSRKVNTWSPRTDRTWSIQNVSNRSAPHSNSSGWPGGSCTCSAHRKGTSTVANAVSQIYHRQIHEFP